MIIKQEDEMLTNLIGAKKIDLDNLIQKSTKIRDSFSKVRVDDMADMPLYPDINQKLMIARKGQRRLATDMTEYAFRQVCGLVNVPARYMQQLYNQDMPNLVRHNIAAQYKYAERKGIKFGNYLALNSEGVTEAVVSDRYSFGFQTPEVLETIKKSMPEQYVPNQAFLSKSRCHIRFVDFDKKEKVGGEDMSVGFTVGTSDIGKAALTVKFFIYKFACTNGIVRICKGGTLYRQTHIGSPFTVENLNDFKKAFSDIEYLRKESLDLIASSQNRMMSLEEMNSILDTSRKSNINISEKERDKIIELATNRYGRTKWGLINGITEVAQDHTLDTRIDYETFAGRILEKVA